MSERRPAYDRGAVTEAIARGQMVQQVAEVAQLLALAMEDHANEAVKAGEEGREYAAGLHHGWAEGLRHASGHLTDLLAQWRSR